MSTPSTGLTKTQLHHIERFLHLFADVELALKRRLHLPVTERIGVCAMVNAFAAINPYWNESANRLRHLSEIRNVLTHQRGTDFGYPVVVTPHAIESLIAIKKHLQQPELVSHRYRTSVLTVASDYSLAAVLTLAFENGFSQFPVVTAGRFSGLVTENEITRWLGRRVRANSAEVNLTSVTVKMLLKEKDPFLRGIHIFRFCAVDAPVEEVMGLFASEPALEVILLTPSGENDTRIEGIITQWDAARYPIPKPARFSTTANQRPANGFTR